MKWHLKHAVHGTKPWAVQAEALCRSDGRKRYGFLLEQGLGKSAATYNEFLESPADICLVAAPNSFKLDWPLVPDEWGVPLPSGAWPRDPIPFKTERALYSINYEALRSSAGDQISELMKKRRVHFVVDEATSIKNPTSKQTKAVLELAKDAFSVRELDGTPLVQNVLDLFPKLKLLGELDGVNPYSFRNQYAIMGGWMNKKIVGMKNEDRLFRLMDRVSFRALKKDWRPDLPDKNLIPVNLEMTPRQARHYKEMTKDFYTMANGLEVSAELVLTQMDKLRQISSCIAMQDGKVTLLEEPGKNPKIRAILDILEGGHGKLIVVHYYRATGQMLLEALRAKGLQPARIAGQMNPEDVLAEKKRFNSDPACRVLVGQESATCRGHTLLGGTGTDRCHRMAFFENSFSLMERRQIEDRIHRGEQDYPCDYFDLITSQMDRHVIDILTGKAKLADFVDNILRAIRSKEF